MSNSKFNNKKIDRQPFRVEFEDARYPNRIESIMNGKAPKHLDMVGNFDLLSMAGLGICGARNSSPKGLEIARDCAHQAASKNVSVISGNAAGVDLEAHYSCLETGGKAILVIPEGINHFRIRKKLRDVWDWDRILVISQFEPDEPWKSFRAMIRNKLIIALSRAVVVIEARDKGGTLNAGEETLRSGLPLYVAEYQDASTQTCGNQFLLNKGALKLTKKRLESKTNLKEVFESINEDRILQMLPLQGRLI